MTTNVNSGPVFPSAQASSTSASATAANNVTDIPMTLEIMDKAPVGGSVGQDILGIGGARPAAFDHPGVTPDVFRVAGGVSIQIYIIGFGNS